MQFGRDALSAEGFRGFVTFAVLREGGLDLVPQKPGVYVVLRQSQAHPAFLARNPGGRFKGRDPTVPVPELERKWVAGVSLVYVGKGSNLLRRLRQFAAFGAGRLVGHWGGRYIWQLADDDDLLVGWRPVAEPETEAGAEGALVARFKASNEGLLPFANIIDPS